MSSKNSIRKPSASLLRRRLREIKRDILVGGVLAILLLIGKLLFEPSTPGKLLDNAVYSLLQTRLITDDKLPVVVVDISNLDEAPVPGRLTPRQQIIRLVDALFEQGALAVGIDVDFSPERTGFTARGGPQFFDHVRSFGKPVFLGVSRTRYAGRAEWLGSEDYQDLAVSIAVPAEDRRKMPLWFRKGNSGSCLDASAAQLMGIKPEPEAQQSHDKSSCLPSMALSLARQYHTGDGHGAHVPPWFLEPVENFTIDGANELHTANFLVDYSPVGRLQARTSSAVVSGNDVQIARSQTLNAFTGKIVILGNTRWTPDTFSIPPWNKEVAGVYLHASAVYTLLKGPLHEITWLARLGLDLLFAGLALATVSVLRLYLRREVDEVAIHRVNFVATLFGVIIVVAVGYGMVAYTRILWTDFLLVSLALVLHDWLEPHVGPWLKDLPKTTHKIVFEPPKENSN